MSAVPKSRIPDILKTCEQDVLKEWLTHQLSATTLRSDLMKESELRQQSTEFIRLLSEATHRGTAADLDRQEWAALKGFLCDISASRARQGFTPSETATFVLSLKQPIFDRLHQEYSKDADGLSREVWNATDLLDQLALLTTDAYQKGREELIVRQQRELMELSTPVVRLWDGVLALPLIGTLDSERTQVVMQNLLEKIVETGSAIAIIDITGVPIVDTLVAQHLLKTVAAARLMGADCIISGIRPQIAQTIVHLGVDLKDVITKATLSDALSIAFQRTGYVVRKSAVSTDSAPSNLGNGNPGHPKGAPRGGRSHDM
ncbi:STAS domain-containing protein [Nitrospira sp. Nam74]